MAVPADPPTATASGSVTLQKIKVPVMGYSKYTKRAPGYLNLKLDVLCSPPSPPLTHPCGVQSDRGNHPSVHLLVTDNDDDGGEIRLQETRRYINEQVR